MATVSEGEDWVANLRATGEVQSAALARLNRYLVGGLRRSFQGKGVDEAFCEDIAQESVIKVLEKLDQFEGRSRFTTWAMSIAIRRAVSELRKKRYQNVSLNQLSDGEYLQIDIPDPSLVDPDQDDLLQSTLFL